MYFSQHYPEKLFDPSTESSYNIYSGREADRQGRRGEKTGKQQAAKTSLKERLETLASPQQNASAKKLKRRKTTMLHVSKQRPEAPVSTPTSVGNSQGAWRKVGKKQRPPSKGRPQRADILVIKMKEKSEYPDMLRLMKTDPEMMEFKESITKIQRTAAGSMLFELDRKAIQKTDQIRDLMKTKFGEKGQVTCRTDTMVLELKDFDEVTEKAEIVQALQDELEGAQGIDVTAVKSLRKAYGGTHTTVIVLPVDIANKALSKDKVKVGWVVSRVKQKSTVQQCFKCLG